MQSGSDPLFQPDSDRVIDLGDVRRRRKVRRRSSDGSYLIGLGVLAAGSWLAWALVVLNIPPHKLVTYAAFFVPLWLALASTATLVSYAAERRRGDYPKLRVDARRGVLVASVIAVNLAFEFAHAWSLPILLISIVLAAGIEGAYQRREES
ncbi:MAG: hypothetical protein ACRDFS_12055 [Chloroflexota bacterium]